MASGLPHAQFINLVRVGTGLSFRVVVAWTTAEGGPTDNPLNIGPGRRYGSPTAAAAAVVALLRKDVTNRYGYASILASAGKKDSDQLKAIVLSSWDAGHYGGAGQNLEATYNRLFPSGKIRIGITDVTVKNPVTQIDDAAKLVAGGTLSLLTKLISTQTWIRVLIVFFGAIALIGALVIFSRELAK